MGMRIGLISYEYPPQKGPGGVGAYIYRLAGALAQAGHEVHVIAGPSEHQDVPQPNVHLHRIQARYEIKTSNSAVRWFYWQGVARAMGWIHPAIWHWLKWDLASLEAIEAIDRQHPFDLVEVPEHAANGWMAGHIHRWPIVVRMHCPWELFVRINRFPFNPMNRVLAHLERWTVARYADGLTVPSEAMRREVLRSWKTRRPPVVIPNFMDVPEAPAPLPPDSQTQTILSVGRIEPLKGQDVLALAFAQIARKHPRARLVYLGPDRWPGRRSFEELLPLLVPDPAIRSRIVLAGNVPMQQVGRMLTEARVAVTASRGFESFSYACLEALAAARPVIATTTGALPELVEHGRSGLIVHAGDVEEMSQALDRLLGDRALSEDLSLNAHVRARTMFDTQAVLPRMMAAYQDASDFFCHVRAAQSELTARQWRRALDSARSTPTDDSPQTPPSPYPRLVRARRDVA